MESINTLSGGMNSDLSKTFHTKDSYLQALNFRNNTELGESNGSLVNIKGNECKISFPDLKAIYKLIVTKGSVSSNTNALTITINSQTHAGLTLTNETSSLEVYNFIVNKFTNCYQNTTVATKTFAIAYTNDYIVIYQQPIYTDCGPLETAIEPTITISYTNSTSGTHPVLMFYNTGIANSITQNVQYPYILGHSKSTIIPIGSSFILNEVYIFTAINDLSYGPAGIPGEKPANDEFKYNGAIWKLMIDDDTKNHTLKLIYSNNLDFTKFHPIPPSAVSGRYESINIKRLYWSDNYNKVRNINTEDSNVMALSPSLLNVIPKVEYTQPILNSIITGSLIAGSYQVGYRLFKVLGSKTNFSEISNPVYLNPTAESTGFIDYVTGTGATSKGISWKIDGLDTSYDQIEFVVIYKSTQDAIPVLTSVGLTTLSENMIFNYTNASTSGYEEVTLEEFLLFNGTFTHAKTCDTKDNRLFWGNVRSLKKDLELYDARAFRARDTGSGVSRVTLNNIGVSTNLTYTAAKALPQTSDAINEYYDSSGNYSTNACYLKPTDLTKLGGEGTNISYEFGTEIINADNNFSIGTTENWDISSPDTTASPYRNSDTINTSPTGLIYTYPQNSKFQAMKQPERTSLLKGFQHEEIYRFGIQFFDKEGNPYFTKWIGDIKMPAYGDKNDNPGDPSITDFRLTYSPTPDKQYLQILYIKFTVNTSSIEDLISGYQIVRVKREGNNRTIWGVGMINPVMPRTNAPSTDTEGMIPAGWDSKTGIFGGAGPGAGVRRYYTPFPNQASVETLNINNDSSPNSRFGTFKMFDCWDMDMGFRPSYDGNDRLLVRSILSCINYKSSNGGYRAFFGTKGLDTSGNPTPANNVMIDDGSVPPFTIKSNNDAGQLEPFFIMKMLDTDVSIGKYSNFVHPYTHDYGVTTASYVQGNDSVVFSGFTLYNRGEDIHSGVVSATSNPCFGKQTLFVELDNPLYTSGVYGCTDGTSPTDFKKVLALYYKPNNSLYGGATYVNRTNNEYIPCGEYVSINKKGSIVNTNISFKCFGGDVFSVINDMMKTVKNTSSGSEYHVYTHNGSGVPISVDERRAQFSTTFYFPATSVYNQEVRAGYHTNRSLNDNLGWGNEEEYIYDTYNNAENDTKVYFPKPLNFQTTDEWVNRIYFSEIKFNNEIEDSWAQYLTNSFYDVEGNYGPINALVSLRENMYYLQERGVGLLMINPVSMVNDSLGQPIKLGASNEVIQKHYYKAIDSGTSHQWSVYRSQSAILFTDVRHKKIYLFNGESLTPISDVKGQRNFTIKRLHNELLVNDNPVIGKGVLSTYDYYNNEFLITFLNKNTLNPSTKDENYTISYSEASDNFVSLYSFTPNLYINNNKYLWSNIGNNSLYFHNYGDYCKFYGVLYPSTLKLMVNEQPLYTKVFDNLVIQSDAIRDNVEWSDDLNEYPGAITSPSYPDNVNYKNSTFDKLRVYNDYQNSDWIDLDFTGLNPNIKRKERSFNIQVPRNKFDYDTYNPSTYSIFDPSKLTKTFFGERFRDKWLNIDLSYNNSLNLRFIIHNIKSIFRISDR